MAELIEKGSWVEIESTVLPAGERALQVPDDTQQVALMMRARGTLLDAASMGDEVVIETTTGRQLLGRMIAVNPAYDHSFGAPLPELYAIATEARALLEGKS